MLSVSDAASERDTPSRRQYTDSIRPAISLPPHPLTVASDISRFTVTFTSNAANAVTQTKANTAAAADKTNFFNIA